MKSVKRRPSDGPENEDKEQNIQFPKAVQQEQLVGDFIAHYGSRFPDIIDAILLKVSPMKLDQCRVVSTAWRNYIDNENLQRKLKKPDGSVWMEKNRKMSSDKVFTMPHQVEDMVYDKKGNHLLLIYTKQCSLGHKHKCLTLYQGFLSCKEPFTFGAQEYQVPAQADMRCEHKFSKFEIKMARSFSYFDNSLNFVFLKDYLVFTAQIDEKARLIIFDYRNQSYVSYAMPDEMHGYGIAPIVGNKNYPNGLVLFTMLDQFYTLETHAFGDVGEYNQYVEEENGVIVQEYFPFAAHHNISRTGLQIFNSIGVVINYGHSPSPNFFTYQIFKLPEYLGEPLKMVHINTKVQMGNKLMEIRIPNLYEFKHYVIVDGQPLWNHTMPGSVMRCYNREDGSTIWTKHGYINIFCLDHLLLWSTYIREDGTKTIHCWDTNFANPDKTEELILPSVAGEYEWGGTWVKMGPNLLAVPMKNVSGLANTITIYILDLSDAMKLMKRIEINVATDIPKPFEAAYIKFFTDGPNMYLKYSRINYDYSNDTVTIISRSHFQIFSLSLKKKTKSEIPSEPDAANYNYQIETVNVQAEIYDM